MTRTERILSRETRALRAVLFALAVLAQLLLPAIVLHGEALAGDLCFAGAADRNGDAEKSKPHAHEQQCAHCRLQDVVPALEPSEPAIASVSRIEVDRAYFAAIDLPAGTAVRVQPPPTGPPVS